MAEAKKTGSRDRYWMLDANCIGCSCFAPGEYQHRGATCSGSKNSGTSKTCMTNAYRGCPDDRKFEPELAKKRKIAGWKISIW